MKRGIHTIGIQYGYLLIIASYLLLQCIFLPQFGLTADEPILEYRADLAADYVKQIFTTGDFNFKIVSPGIQSHPVFYSFLLRFFSQALQRLFSLPYYQSMHVLNILVSALGIGILFAFTKKIFGTAAAYAAVLFFLICPRLWAHSHYNPKDVPVMVFSLAAVYYFYRLMRDGGKAAAVRAVLFWVLALSTKLSVILLSPVFVMIAVKEFIAVKKRNASFKQVQLLHKKLVKKVLLFVLFSAAGIYLLWPYLWARPFFFFEALLTYASDFQEFPVLYMGSFFQNTGLPFHYYPFYFITTIPIPVLIFFVIGVVFLLSRRRRFTVLLFAGLWFLLPLVLNSLPGISRYDGFRQLFYILPPVFMISSYGLVRSVHFAVKRSPLPVLKQLAVWPAPLLIAVIMLPAFVRLHPFEGAYFNAIFRAAYREDIQDRFHFDYWGASYLRAAELLKEMIAAEKQEGGGPVKVYVPVFPWIMEAYADKAIFAVTLDEGEADYVVSLSRYNRRNRREYFSSLTPAAVLSRYRSVLCSIYRNRN